MEASQMTALALLLLAALRGANGNTGTFSSSVQVGRLLCLQKCFEKT
jgi:hypothetical protein